MDIVTMFIAGMFFGAPLGLWLARKPKAVEQILTASTLECAQENCGSQRDPRCAGNNCSECCQSAACCSGRCLDVWEQKQLAALGLCRR